MKKTSVLLLIAMAVLPVVFSSCSSLASSSTAGGSSTAGASIADHEHYNAAAMGYENSWPYGQNTYR